MLTHHLPSSFIKQEVELMTGNSTGGPSKAKVLVTECATDDRHWNLTFFSFFQTKTEQQERSDHIEQGNKKYLKISRKQNMQLIQIIIQI